MVLIGVVMVVVGGVVRVVMVNDVVVVDVVGYEVYAFVAF